MAVEFIIKNADGSVNIDLSKRIAVLTDSFSYPINNGRQPEIITKLGPMDNRRYWAYVEVPNVMGARYDRFVKKPIMYPVMSVLVTDKVSLSKSPSNIYKAAAATMDAGYYYLYIRDESEPYTSYDSSVVINVGTY